MTNPTPPVGRDLRSTGEDKRKCSWCNRNATKQTVKGKQNQVAGGLPQNDGWFCRPCWEKGVEIENEAMYG